MLKPTGVACFIMFFLMCQVGLAMPNDFFSQHTQGWHWYQSPQKIKTQKQLQMAQLSDPIQTMKALHQTLNRALDRAILFPTPENIKHYMRLQQLVTKRADTFTARWQQVLLANPKLDYAIAHPTSSIGREIYLNQYQQKENQAIHAFAQHQGLFFFYRGDCPYCHRFAPILKAFVDTYHIKVIPISIGGGFLPQFPQSRFDKGQAKRLHVKVYPSLYAVNPTTHKIIPVGFGLMSADALRQRILNIVTDFKGEN